MKNNAYILRKVFISHHQNCYFHMIWSYSSFLLPYLVNTFSFKSNPSYTYLSIYIYGLGLLENIFHIILRHCYHIIKYQTLQKVYPLYLSLMDFIGVLHII